MKKKMKDSRLVKWILFIAVIFGGAIYGSHPGWTNTLISIFLFGLGLDFFFRHILGKKK